MDAIAKLTDTTTWWVLCLGWVWGSHTTHFLSTWVTMIAMVQHPFRMVVSTPFNALIVAANGFLLLGVVSKHREQMHVVQLWSREHGQGWQTAKQHEYMHVWPDDIEAYGAHRNYHTGPSEHNPRFPFTPCKILVPSIPRCWFTIPSFREPLIQLYCISGYRNRIFLKVYSV